MNFRSFLIAGLALLTGCATSFRPLPPENGLYRAMIFDETVFVPVNWPGSPDIVYPAGVPFKRDRVRASDGMPFYCGPIQMNGVTSEACYAPINGEEKFFANQKRHFVYVDLNGKIVDQEPAK